MRMNETENQVIPEQTHSSNIEKMNQRNEWATGMHINLNWKRRYVIRQNGFFCTSTVKGLSAIIKNASSFVWISRFFLFFLFFFFVFARFPIFHIPPTVSLSFIIITLRLCKAYISNGKYAYANRTTSMPFRAKERLQMFQNSSQDSNKWGKNEFTCRGRKWLRIS